MKISLDSTVTLLIDGEEYPLETTIVSIYPEYKSKHADDDGMIYITYTGKLALDNSDGK